MKKFVNAVRAAVGKVSAGVRWLLKNEPALTLAVLYGAADTVQAGLRDGLGAKEIARAVTAVVLGLIIRAKVTPADPVPPPAPAGLPAPTPVPVPSPLPVLDPVGFPVTPADPPRP